MGQYADEFVRVVLASPGDTPVLQPDALESAKAIVGTHDLNATLYQIIDQFKVLDIAGAMVSTTKMVIKYLLEGKGDIDRVVEQVLNDYTLLNASVLSAARASGARRAGFSIKNVQQITEKNVGAMTAFYLAKYALTRAHTKDADAREALTDDALRHVAMQMADIQPRMATMAHLLDESIEGLPRSIRNSPKQVGARNGLIAMLDEVAKHIDSDTPLGRLLATGAADGVRKNLGSYMGLMTLGANMGEVDYQLLLPFWEALGKSELIGASISEQDREEAAEKYRKAAEMAEAFLKDHFDEVKAVMQKSGDAAVAFRVKMDENGEPCGLEPVDDEEGLEVEGDLPQALQGKSESEIASRVKEALSKGIPPDQWFRNDKTDRVM